ncbi:MAG: universal stress protein [Usitatibacteraceae bacterium]
MIPYKTILVHVDGRPRNAQALRVACDLAARFDAHLAAIYALEQHLYVPVMDAGAAAVMQAQLDLNAQMQANAQSMIRAEEQHSGRSIEWRGVSGDTVNTVMLHARHADLLVISQEDPEQKMAMEPSLVANVVIGAGRPVLVVPYAGNFKSCGSSVLVGWSGTREAARAVADALPLLLQAKTVNIVSFNPRGDSTWGDIPGADIGVWLARHGVRVTVRQQKSDEVDVGNQMLSLAADMGSDLIVMGAYGHSRTFEFVLGGVTKTLLTSMTVPVLMSH